MSAPRAFHRALVAGLAALGLLAAEAPTPPTPPTELPGVRLATQAADAPFAAMLALQNAQADLAARRYRAAVGGFRLVLTASPGLEAARRGLAEAALGAGDPHAADAAMEGLDAPVLRALVDADLGRLDDPETALGTLFDATGDARLLNRLGEWLDDRGRGAEARMAFRRAGDRQRPGLASSNIGLSFLRQGETAKAMAAFERAVAEDPADPAFARNARLCALQRGDYARALDGVAGAQAGPLLREAGAGALARGEFALASLLLERAESLSPRFDPRVDALRRQLDQQRADPAEHAQ